MATTHHPTAEINLVNMLLSRNGSRTCIITVDGEAMKVTQVEITELPASWEWDRHAESGGVGLSADGGKYVFYSTEVGTVEDGVSGAILYARETEKPR